MSTTAAELEAAPSVADLAEHPGAEAFAAAVAAGAGSGTAPFDDLDVWKALDVDDQQLGAIRPLDPPDIMDGEVRDHERLTVSLVDGAWHISSAGSCSLRAELDGLAPATVLLDPESLPAADDTSLSLLVVEMACASGQLATGRVSVTVEKTAEEVRLVAGVRPLEGGADCPSNPPTPVTIELDEPLGNRLIVDAARLPAIEVQPHQPLVGPQAGG